MNAFDILFYSIFLYFKPKYKQKSNTIAIVYVSVLQCALLLLLGVFFAGFFSKMHVSTMSQEKAWIIFILVSGFVCFKNWMQYTGKRRMMINAKMNKKKSNTYNIWLLFLLPVLVLGLTYVLSMAV
ncbi:hypothetical protein [Thalassobellus suaedae]|uniref:Uncharacterized protein n=1 Tax=Thalassobellus suaedae TaxID=3074124 RepID=A0ABY9Y694_9FLAO|nr:hypothetical protein RHP49_05855 [Flavobacteriaceae bacterium HL-DH10]